jgi:hypothetical protein
MQICIISPLIFRKNVFKLDKLLAESHSEGYRGGKEEAPPHVRGRHPAYITIRLRSLCITNITNVAMILDCPVKPDNDRILSSDIP